MLVAPLTHSSSPGAASDTLSAGLSGGSRAAPARQAQLVAYHAGATTDGFALVGVGTPGALQVSNEGPSAVTVSLDVEGYVAGQDRAAAGGSVVPLLRPRLIASGRHLAAGQRARLTAAGVPARAAVGLLVQVTGRAAGPGQLRSVLADGAEGAALADYAPGAPVSDLAVVGLNGGQFGLVNAAAGRAIVSVTVVGYLTRSAVAAGGSLVPVTPATLTSAPLRVAAGKTVNVPVTGNAGVPQAGVVAAAIGVTATSGPGQALSVGLSGPGNPPSSAAQCVGSAGTCTGFALPRLSGAVSEGVVAVHNYSAVPAVVSLDAFGYLAARTVPAAPAAVTASVRRGSATVTWQAPAADGGAAVSGYTVAMSPGDRRIRVPARASRLVIPRLRGDVAYTFTVAARNAAGAGAAGVGRVIPAGTPRAPGQVAVRAAGSGRVRVSWTPAGARGAALTGYRVTIRPGGFTAAAPPAGRSVAVTGLVPGAVFVACVSATSKTGAAAQACAAPRRLVSAGTLAAAPRPAGAAAAPRAVSPQVVPGAPTAVTATAGNAQAKVTWKAPATTGGTITSYKVTSSPGAKTATATGLTATVTGLTNGTAYTFTVKATNASGTGAASAKSAAVTPSAPPGAPTAVTAKAGNAQATVSWTAPASTGGGAITGYTVTAAPGGAKATAAGTAKSATVTGLTNGTAYTFTVTAATVGGAGPASAASAAVTPVGPPGAPTAVKATAGNGQATVTWTAPAATGGSAITGYTVTASDGTTATAAATATSATVTGLANGTSYTFTVTAKNKNGTSAASAASAAVTPTGPPGAPEITSAAPAAAKVTVSWTAPASNGGSPITGYTVTVEPGGTKTSAAATATSVAVTGLTNGTGYTFTVSATTALGAGPASESVGPVTPVGLPGAPTAVTAVAGDTTAMVSWTPPATGGTAVTGYTVTAAPGGAKVTTAGTTTAATITGLTDGTSYTFTVTATDGAGTGAASVASAAVIPDPVPGAPTNVQATVGNATAAVSWTAPASTGGSPITGYTVTASPGGATASVAGTVTTTTVTGLTNGTAYRFTVRAANAHGSSAPSASSAAATPSAPLPPDAPFITNVTAQSSAVGLVWSPPDTGTASLTGYVITATSGGATVSTVTAAATATTATVSGLMNGTDYTFTIAAVNGNGTSVSSPPSTPVAPRPATAPMAVANLTAVPQNGQLQAGWVAGPDGGSPVTGYTVTVSPATAGPVAVAANTTVATVSGLTNGTAYTVSVTATNAAGTGPAAQAAPVTPQASIVPGAPANVIASATAAGSVAVQWDPPMSSGTAAITGYAVSATAAGTVAKTQSAPSTACTGTPVQCSASMTGLTSTTAYTFTVTATSTAGTSAASAVTDAVTPNIVVSQAPVMLSSAAAATLRYVETDGTLIFEQPPAQVTGLASGDLVFLPVVAAAPQGFLGKVVRVSSEGGLVAVVTSPATLNDVYSSYDTSMNLPFNGVSAQLINAAPGVSLSRPEVRGHALAPTAPAAGVSPADTPFSVQWADGGLTLNLDMDLLEGDSKEADESPVTAGAVAHVEGSVTVSPILHASFGSGALNFTVGGSVKADLDARFGVHLATEQKVYLGSIQGPTVDVQVAEVPVPSKVVFTAYAVLETDGAVGVALSASYDHTSAAQCDIDFNDSSNDNCSPVDQDDDHEGGLDGGVGVYASMEVSAGIQLGVSLQIAYLAGPEITVTPELEFTADTTENPWWTLGLKGLLGVAVTTGQAWGEGKSLYENDDLITFGPLDLAHASGAFNALEIAPSQANLAVGDQRLFQATLITAGVRSNPAVTWQVASGPGTITSSGFYSATQNGVAVIEADENGLTARASVVIGPALQTDASDNTLDSDTRGLVDAAVASWAGIDVASTPTEYAVTAQAQTPGLGGGNAAEVVYVPASATHAYLPGLTPGAAYTLTVYAVGAGGGVVGSAIVTALEPPPGVLAGTSAHGDIAVSATTGKPDDTGTAGTGGATVSGNGQYAFFFTEARSNLAPAAIHDPASEDTYLLRKNLITGAIDVASIDLDGQTPIPAATAGLLSDDEGPNIESANPVTNADGSAVAFLAASDEEYQVYDFTTQTTWQVGSADVFADYLEKVSDDGTVVAFAGVPGDSFVDNIYRQVEGGTPQQVDSCPTDTTPTCAGETDHFSMSDNGALIAYEAIGAMSSTSSYIGETDIYAAASGQDSIAFAREICHPVPSIAIVCSHSFDPVISGDGATLAEQFEDPATDSALVLKKLNGSQVTAGDFVAVGDGTQEYKPWRLSENGSALAYDTAPEFAAVELATSIEIRTSGGATAQLPQLADTGIDSLGLADSVAVYTLQPLDSDGDETGPNYPGVYELKFGN